MIWIERKILFIKISNRYFYNKEHLNYCLSTLNGFSHSLVKNERLQSLQTVHIDLEKSESALLADIHKENRRQIRKAEKQNMQFLIVEQPTELELKRFQMFYNRFAKSKNTFRFGSFHLTTMKKLMEKNALVFTYVTDQTHQQLYCYRIYVSDGEFAMTLYSASNVGLQGSPQNNRLLSEANRYAIWRNIIYFKEKGVKKIDMGGLTDQPSIRDFKLGFGGEIVTVYSGYETSSAIGRLVLTCRKNVLKRGRLKSE